jgi:hypothetical protein
MRKTVDPPITLLAQLVVFEKEVLGSENEIYSIHL